MLLAERTLYSARFHLLILALGGLYFGLAEGLWGAGLGKHARGLLVVRPDGKRPGVLRGLLRILVPLGAVEVVRWPLMLATIPDANWTGLQTAWFVGAAVLCPWLAVLMTLTASRENGYATVWDLISQTRVVVRPNL